jgi:hypothetical protein
MSGITVPANDGSAAGKLQTAIANFVAIGTPDALSRAEAARRDLVNTLIADQHLSAALVLSTCSYTPPAGSSLGAQIVRLTALALSTTPAGLGAAAELASVQARYVAELMANPRSGLTGNAILTNASLAYVGSAAQLSGGG